MEAAHPDTGDVYRAMFRALAEPGVLPVVEAASKLLGAPVVFTDDRYHLIALYPAARIGDPVYDALFEHGELPIDVIADYQQAYLLQPGKYYAPFYAEHGPAEAWPRIFAEVRNEERILGHLGVLVGRTAVEPWQLEATAILTETLRLKLSMAAQPFMSLPNSLAILLDDESPENLRAKAALNIYESRQHPGLLLAAPLNMTTGHQAFAPVAINRIQQISKNVIPTLFENDVVALITSRLPQPALEPLKETAASVARFLAQHQIACGVAEPVGDLRDLPGHFWQAHLTAVIASGQGARSDLSYFEDLAPAQFYRFFVDSGRSRFFIHPLLPQLRDYDDNNATEFYATLSAYCRNLFDKSDAAQALRIHRNTLLYRLGRIETLFGVDLKDNRVLHRLLLSFELAEMAAGLSGGQP